MMRWDDGWDAEPRRKPWSKPFKYEKPRKLVLAPSKLFEKTVDPVNHLDGAGKSFGR
jgi:hypothetical protein